MSEMTVHEKLADAIVNPERYGWALFAEAKAEIERLRDTIDELEQDR